MQLDVATRAARGCLALVVGIAACGGEGGVAHGGSHARNGDAGEPGGTGGTTGAGAGGGSGWPATSGASGTGAAGGEDASGGDGGIGASGGAGTGGEGGSTGAGGVPSICPPTCDAVPGAPAYGSLQTIGAKTDRPPPEHADLNVKLRGWERCGDVSCGATGSTLGLVRIPPDSGGVDPAAPRLHSLFSPDRVPAFANNYRGYDWDWACASSPQGCRGGLITKWDVHLVGFATIQDEILRLPASGYDIGQGYSARVLYADGDSVTLKFTGEDNVVYGYTIHVVGICLEPTLRALYDADDAAGRDVLPAIRSGDPVGRACGSETLVSIRDTGQFMDPRSETDWWQGHP